MKAGDTVYHPHWGNVQFVKDLGNGQSLVKLANGVDQSVSSELLVNKPK